MFTWSIGLIYTGGDNFITQHYYVLASDDVTAIDKALNSFYSEFGLNFDDDIEYIEWSYCRL